MSASLITSYFQDLSSTQKEQFLQLNACYRDWNKKINVISRKDIDHLYLRHVLHALSIARLISFSQGAHILDIGTGGGVPGIPLAIKFPAAHFHLVDSIKKKITVVTSIVHQLGLLNVTVEQNRAELLKDRYDFAISRTVAPINVLYQWVDGKIKSESKHKIKNGMLCLKGGDLKEELSVLNKQYHVYNISDYFKEPFFETKKIIHVPLS